MGRIRPHPLACTLRGDDGGALGEREPLIVRDHPAATCEQIVNPKGLRVLGYPLAWLQPGGDDFQAVVLFKDLRFRATLVMTTQRSILILPP